MTVTEEEAKKKACCKGSHPTTVNNGPCIASDCMAWRGTESVCRHKERGTLHSLDVMDPKYNDANNYEVVPPKGYCGLAGSP